MRRLNPPLTPSPAAWRTNLSLGGIMLFEVLGFLSGVAGIGAAFWLLYQRDSSRVVEGVYGVRRGRQRA